MPLSPAQQAALDAARTRGPGRPTADALSAEQRKAQANKRARARSQALAALAQLHPEDFDALHAAALADDQGVL